jgi:hypothetical protein
VIVECDCGEFSIMGWDLLKTGVSWVRGVVLTLLSCLLSLICFAVIIVRYIRDALVSFLAA